MKYTVILPTYNEAENVKVLIPNILSLGKDYYVLVVDDNSPDGTANVVGKIMKHNSRVALLKREKKLGLGSAYRYGMKKILEGDSDYIIEMDADLSHDYRDLPRFVECMKDFDLMVGSRYVDGIGVENWSISRLILSYLGNFTTRLVTGLKISDNTSGFKCFSRRLLMSIDMDNIYSSGYAFQIEMNYRASQKGFRIGEMPIIFKERVSGISKLSGGIILEALFVICGLRMGSMFKKNR